MRSGGALRALCVAAAVMACGADRALAQALDPDTPQPDGLSGGTKVERVLLYAGFDIWRYGRTGYGGFYWAPGGLNNDGFITRLFVSGGVERYDAGQKRFNTTIIRAAPLAGWRLSQGTLELKVFAGPELENRVLTPDVPDREISRHPPRRARRRRIVVGADAGDDADIGIRPHRPTRPATAHAPPPAGVCSTGSGPARKFPRPRDAFSQQYRVGAHLTGFRLDALEWSAAAGYVTDSFGRNGIYGRIGVLTRQ